MRIFLCRHGETEWSLSGQHTSYTDIDLTEKGKEQALHFRKRLQRFRFQSIYTSPLKRARETAELAGFSPLLLPDAVEWNYGDYEGLTSQEVHKKCPDWSLFRDGAPGGESPSQVAQRADRVLHQLEGDTLLFSHGHFLRVLAARWLQLPPTSARLFALSVASLSILGHERNQPVLELWNSP